LNLYAVMRAANAVETLMGFGARKLWNAKEQGAQSASEVRPADNGSARLPRMAKRDVKALRDRVEKSNLTQITEACNEELARRPIDFSEADALRFEEMAIVVADLDLYHAICFAFTKASFAKA
jgi:hypothetical protein